jgi:hypothetical protein
MDTYEGGCHCGKVRFRVRVREHVAWDCNCSICVKKGFLHVIVTKEDFELLRGESELALYTFGTGVARHTFCKTCGMHPFYVPRSHPDGIDVNLRCFDGHGASGWGRFTIAPFDGQNWEQAAPSIQGTTGA